VAAHPLGAGSLWALAPCAATGTVFAAGRGALVAVAGFATPSALSGPSLSVLHASPHGTYACLLSRDGRTVYAACGDGCVRSFDAASGAALQERPLPPAHLEPEDGAEAPAVHGTYCLALCPLTSDCLLAGSGDGCVRCWQLGGESTEGQGLEAAFTWPDDHEGAVTALLAVSLASAAPAAVAVVSGGEDGCLVCRHLPAGADAAAARSTPVTWRLDEGHMAGITALAADPAAGCIFSACWDGHVACTALADGAPVPGWAVRVAGGATTADGEAAPQRGATSLALCPRGARLYIGVSDGTILAVCRSTGAVLDVLVPPAGACGGAVCALHVSPDGEHLLAAGTDKTLRAWRVALPAAWAPQAGVHARFPAPFKQAVAQLVLGASDQHSSLGHALGSLDAATRGGILAAVAGALARDVYGV
jgi:WD40 repeat protein